MKGKTNRHCWGYGKRLAGLALAVLASHACVDNPDQALDPGWVQIEPGTGMTVAFQDDEGLLQGIYLQVPPEAVSSPTALRLSLVAATEPVFLLTSGGAQQHTPAVRIEPFNRLFNVPVSLTLPWHTLGETVPTEDVRGWSSDGTEGIPYGLWDTAEVTANLPSSVTILFTRGGFYWAGQWEDGPFREVDQDVGAPCLKAQSLLQDCTDDVTCIASGCMHEVCGVEPVQSYCQPTAYMTAKFGCRCRCAASKCQWVQ